MPELPELDQIVHGQLRLAVLSILSAVTKADFTYLRDRTGSTDGNIAAHLLKLEQAGYISVEKTFQNRKPLSVYRLTEAGRSALTTYIRNLKKLLGKEFQKTK
ncbi:MAG TPA: transcriptional regulator [Alphaproteobacteria bacterium]|nr:transcriptional regulator [Alphaproteobacteria bacterium]